MDMKVFLTQNLRPVARLVFEIYVTKFPSEKGNKSLNSAIYPQKMGLALKKLVFMSRIILLDPKLTPPPNVNFSNFQAEENFFILINFAKIWSEHVLKINTESHNI